MLVKLIRPLLENGWNYTKFVSAPSLSTSNILFQKSSSGASSKPTEKSPNSKNQQQSNIFNIYKIRIFINNRICKSKFV